MFALTGVKLKSGFVNRFHLAPLIFYKSLAGGEKDPCLQKFSKAVSGLISPNMKNFQFTTKIIRTIPQYSTLCRTSAITP